MALKDIAFKRVSLTEWEELRAKLDELKDVLAAYEALEADLIMEPKCWTGPTCKFTGELWDRMIEIQAMRNKALGRFSVPNGSQK